MDLRNVRRAGIGAIAALAALSAACGLTDPDPWQERQDRLDHARAVWESAAISSYRYNLRRECYCGFAGDLAVTVRDGFVTGAVLPDGQDVPVVHLHFIETVHDLFDRVELAIDRRAYRFEAAYHPELGYPTLIDLDPERNTIDEEIRYVAGGLVSLETD